MFRRLGLAETATCVLGAHPGYSAVSRTLDADEGARQFRIFSADPDWVDTLAGVHKRLLPLRYPAEPLLAVYNRLVRTGHLEAGA